jgi:hypothetical protein
MMRTLYFCVVTSLFAVAAGVWTGSGHADEDFKLEEGYTSLFNGKDLTGWHVRGNKENLDGKTEAADGRFEVANGVIVAKEKDNNGKGGIKDLYTNRDFNNDFHLKLEFRAAPRADSGLYIRGPQLQVRDYPTVGPYKPKGFKTGAWNELDITVRSGVVTTSVNGKALAKQDVLELTVKDGKPAAKLNGKEIDVSNIQVSVGNAALCTCNGELLEAAFKVPPKGGIGLQAETGKFEFRRIRIKELK